MLILGHSTGYRLLRTPNDMVPVDEERLMIWNPVLQIEYPGTVRSLTHSNLKRQEWSWWKG